ncbi:interferon-induced protein 44-like isoform X2 [Dasypus novemcinctus]|uniref:interferon-induced protein 44-like isoform X2 n=1 Tax=Dasypus novemcinctus TaxID=9361 RepID=UPI0026601FA1|nr:interferon-induced protein 44-like isoform X2 [Dasypus novemcinctus]
MEVTTRLTWNEEKSLQKLLGNVSLSLLYKSSVHGFSIGDLLQRCSHQGPTVTIIHSQSNIFGVFMLEHYPKSCEDSEEPKLSFCFLFPKGNNTTEIPTFFFNRPPIITDEELSFYFCASESFNLSTRSKQLYINSSIHEKFQVNSRHKYSECEVFRVEGINNPGNIQRIKEVTQHRKNLLTDLRTYKPIADLVPEIRILLLGPIGSGKSSFLNSVKSVFQGHVTHQAITGSDITGITEQFRIYSIKDREYGTSLPFTFCDSMGLAEKEGVGLCVDDIPHILKGCVPDRYQERIHCVVYVFDINSINEISSKMVSKFKRIQKEVLNYGIAHVALLTKVNNCSEVLQENLLNMNRSTTYQSQIVNVNKMLGIPLPNILVVGNYASEWELDPLKDVLILSTLRQMLRATDDSLEDLPLEKTDEITRTLQLCM